MVQPFLSHPLVSLSLSLPKRLLFSILYWWSFTLLLVSFLLLLLLLLLPLVLPTALHLLDSSSLNVNWRLSSPWPAYDETTALLDLLTRVLIYIICTLLALLVLFTPVLNSFSNVTNIEMDERGSEWMIYDLFISSSRREIYNHLVSHYQLDWIWSTMASIHSLKYMYRCETLTHTHTHSHSHTGGLAHTPR